MKMRMKSLVLQAVLLQAAAGLIWIFSLSVSLAEDLEEQDKTKNYAFAPLVVSNPNIGSGAGATGMYFFDIGEITEDQPRSILQAMGAYTHTDSYFGGLISNLYLRQDRIRAVMGIFNAKINNEYRDPLGGEANFATRVLAGFGQASFRILENTFLGAQFLVSDVRYDPDTPEDKDYLDRVGAEDATAAGVGPVLFYDTRDNIHYPSSGTFADIKGFYKPESWGNEASYAVGDAAVNHFYPMKEDHILAFRLYGRTGTEDTPYSDKSRLGQRSDLRGFKSGEISALSLLAGQMEYRWQFARRWGVVAFGGVSKLWDDDLEELIEEDLYYSGGAGIRFMVNTDQKINFRIDVAVGNDDNQAIYVGIREAF